MRFCNLIEGWVYDRIRQSSKTAGDAENDIAQWEFQMARPLSWQSERQPKPTDLKTDREAFLALDQIETH